MDGKHAALQAPAKSESYCFNYKNYFSIVLLALVDADYKFTYIDVGCNGRVPDDGVLKNSTLNEALINNYLYIPPPEPLEGEKSQALMPYVIVADDTFPLKNNVMKPYSSRNLSIEQRIFNYRLSRARKIAENAFGILGSRWRIFQKAIPLAPEKAQMVVLAACALHNFLQGHTTGRGVYTPEVYTDLEDPGTHELREGQWRNEAHLNGWQAIPRQGSNNHASEAKKVRNTFCHYFNSEEGKVPWQRKVVGLGS